jgi:sigma-B regulation protein RsbU (phosphoserine phosphatase)
VSRAQHPDLILLDVMMPGESGFETCALLKADPSTVDIPIVFLSALDSSEDRITGLNASGVDYISKPVHRAEVLVRVTCASGKLTGLWFRSTRNGSSN